jgi:hypothetical protein
MMRGAHGFCNALGGREKARKTISPVTTVSNLAI